MGVSSLGPFLPCVLQLSWQTKINNDDAVYVHSYSTCQVNIAGYIILYIYNIYIYIAGKRPLTGAIYKCLNLEQVVYS